MKKVIVIGSGIAGLAVSIRLALKGYNVQVFEQNSYPGGKLSSFSIKDYRFDAGPSLFTMPHLVTELFKLAGEDVKNYFEFSKKEIACNYFWQDGTSFTAYGERKKFLKEVEKIFDEPQYNVDQYLKKAKKKYDLTSSLFLEQSLHKLKTFISLDTLKALFQLKTFELQKSLHQANTQSFSSTHLIQLFDRYATYNGSDPYQTSGIMTLIQHLESAYGTFVPKKGMVSITESLFGLAKRLGVKFSFETGVKEIKVKLGVVSGIKTNSDSFSSDYVISNMDVFHTYKKLLPNEIPPINRLKQERSSSAVIFYWGIKQSFPDLDLHNIFFSKNYKKEFQAIFKDKTVSEDPTIYINITSKEVVGDAPKGCENWFIMINTPADHGQDWTQIVNRLRSHIITNISKRLSVDLKNLIVCEEVLTPPDIESKTQSYMGALYGASSNDTMAAFLRHPNFSNRIKNLYFCGGSVHPGGGIPLCLLSAKIVDELIPGK
ncbi:MAG: phytoene desaturase family protein [Flavobacteriaceae bacterium]|nr:phytoene desaturase family protein [Flavobacteriaceae bacterium]|tara:strand:+ start:446 stop:1912 length:1467 start_codon:yes stop_codon:yes gene_type:complete